MGTPKLDDKLLNQFQRPTGDPGRVIAAHMNKEHDELTTWGLSHIKIDPAFTVLDIGIGGGRTIRKLASHAVEGKVFGIDYSKDMVDYSKKQNQKLVTDGKILLLQSSVENIPFAEDLFDLVTAVETYYFWPDLPHAFIEIKRVLKSGGSLLIISEMAKDGKYEVDHSEIIAKTHVKLFSIQELRCMLEAEGLKVTIYGKAGSVWSAIEAKKF